MTRSATLTPYDEASVGVGSPVDATFFLSRVSENPSGFEENPDLKTPKLDSPFVPPPIDSVGGG